jgi:rfaE bifunctional protein kinase chain/domain
MTLSTPSFKSLVFIQILEPSWSWSAKIRRQMPESRTLPTTSDLLARIDAMAGRPVILAADLVVDRFITGVPKRISREAPVLILAYEGERLTPGGGANAAANVAALGGRPLLLGIVGDDASGRASLAMLEERGIPIDGVRVRSGYRTPTKTRILGGGAIKQQIVRYDVEDTVALTVQDRDRRCDLLTSWREREPDLSVAVLSDYGYGSVEPALVPVLREVLGARMKILCDSRFRLAEFDGLDGATPNQEEAEALLGAPLPEGRELDATGRRLADLLGTRLLLVTRGSRGMSLIEDGGVFHLPVHGTDQVADVTGAGDTVLGTFALALAAGAEPLEAALLADYAGGVVVMKQGTATLSPEELKDAVAGDPHPIEELRRHVS